MIFLETPRLLFRPHHHEDEPAFIATHTDPQVRRYVGGPAWSKEKATDRFRTEYLGKPHKTYGLWATILKGNTKGEGTAEGKFIGSTGLRFVRAGEASLGLYLTPLYWGRGLATEAAQAFVDLAFGRLKLTHVVADVEKSNLPSERILQKLGFAVTREETVLGSRPHRVLRHYELTSAGHQENSRHKKTIPRQHKLKIEEDPNGGSQIH
jgi:RimJ/RimL family protein N-acetyltransferase